MGGTHQKNKKSGKPCISSDNIVNPSLKPSFQDPNVHFRKIRNINTIIYSLFMLEFTFHGSIPKEILSEILRRMVVLFPTSIPSTKTLKCGGEYRIVLFGDSKRVGGMKY
jgi:hypothetical protein